MEQKGKCVKTGDLKLEWLSKSATVPGTSTVLGVPCTVQDSTEYDIPVLRISAYIDLESAKHVTMEYK